MKLKSILLYAGVLAFVGNATALSTVTTGGKKYTLLEEATGTWCQWCPDGAQVIQEKVEPYGAGDTTYTRAIVASFHNGSSDKMTLPNDPFNNSVANGGTGYITGFPGGTVDRVPYVPASATDISVYRRYWPNAVGDRCALAPKFDVSMRSTWDSVTRLLTVTVKAKVLSTVTGAYRINAYIVEDSLASNFTGFKQTSASAINAGTYTSESGSATWYAGYGTTIADSTKYCHMDVVRKILSTSLANGIATGIWGDSAFINPAVGDSFEKTYTYTMPATINTSICHPKYTKVIGLVQKYGTATTDRAIENCIEAKVRYMWKTLPTAGVADTRPIMDVEVFPNPAKEVVIVKGVLAQPSDVDITISNALGQTVFTRHFEKGGSMFGENLHISDLANGTYFMNIATEGGNVTKQFVIAK